METPRFDSLGIFIKIFAIIIIAGILASIVLPMLIEDKRRMEMDDKLRIIKEENDSLRQINKGLMVSDSLLLITVDSLTKLSSEKKVEYIYLKNRKNEKIKIVDNYTSDDIDSALSNIKTY